jgi:hypothetical protein
MMNASLRTLRAAVASTLAILSICTIAPREARAQTSGVEFRATGYGYVPSLEGSMKFPTGGDATIDVKSDTLLDNTNLALMGAFEVQKGRWGGFADGMYFNVASTRSNASTFDISGVQLPPGIAADASLDVKSWVFTTAANFRAVSTPRVTLDLFGGGRLLKVKSELGWEFNTDVGPFAGPARRGAGTSDNDNWDGVGGVKGRISFSKDSGLFVPYYADAGAGQSDLTWQAMAGVGYAFRHAELLAVWRYLEYEIEPGNRLETINFNGPTAGVTFRW